MTLSVVAITADYGSGVFYTEGFRAVFEDHIEWLRKHPETKELPVTPEDAYRYEYRLEHFLIANDISPDLFWFAYRMNYLTQNADFDQTVRTIYIPSPSTMNLLASTYMTTFKSI